MSATAKVLLGISTFLPFILFVLYILSFFPTAMHRSGGEMVPEAGTWGGIFSLGLPLLIFLIMLANSIALFVYYFVHVINNPRLDAPNRLVWALIILFLFNVGFVVYYYFQIWREEDDRVDHSYLN